MYLLDNITWHTLAGPHAVHSAGADDARRYARGFSPIVGFADPVDPNFAALAPWCEPDEHFYCDGWTGAVPAGWRIDVESTMFKMVWKAPMPASDAAPEAVRLGLEHAAQALDLATLTRPGPFGPRTPELGEYFGVFDGPRLIAMAGERMSAGTLREISGVCTHPDFQGLGLARGLDRQIDPAPDAARRDAVPARDARQRRCAPDVRTNGIRHLPGVGRPRRVAQRMNVLPLPACAPRGPR